ncbi:helix-turn-helix transcriptional regulator [Providencia rettgeri]|nr:helix-turn-helix transcriptional regulator [Providencia rettgeri]
MNKLAWNYRILEKKGLSGSDLAKKLKISQQQISRYERGICSINCGMLFSILFYLEIECILKVYH